LYSHRPPIGSAALGHRRLEPEALCVACVERHQRRLSKKKIQNQKKKKKKKKKLFKNPEGKKKKRKVEFSVVCNISRAASAYFCVSSLDIMKYN
jgi:hypothetical protein